MAEKKYTEHLGLTQQSEEDFVDGEEISRSFAVLDEKIWENVTDLSAIKQEIGNTEDLNTASKDIVGAVNELNADLDSTKTEVGRKANSDELAKTNNLLKDYLITREFSVQYNIPGNSTANYAVNPPVVSGYKLLYCFCNITNTGQVTCHYCDTNRVYFWNHAANAKSAIAILRAIYIRN